MYTLDLTHDEALSVARPAARDHLPAEPPLELEPIDELFEDLIYPSAPPIEFDPDLRVAIFQAISPVAIDESTDEPNRTVAPAQNRFSFRRLIGRTASAIFSGISNFLVPASTKLSACAAATINSDTSAITPILTNMPYAAIPDWSLSEMSPSLKALCDERKNAYAAAYKEVSAGDANKAAGFNNAEKFYQEADLLYVKADADFMANAIEKDLLGRDRDYFIPKVASLVNRYKKSGLPLSLEDKEFLLGAVGDSDQSFVKNVTTLADDHAERLKRAAFDHWVLKEADHMENTISREFATLPPGVREDLAQISHKLRSLALRPPSRPIQSLDTEEVREKFLPEGAFARLFATLRGAVGL